MSETKTINPATVAAEISAGAPKVTPDAAPAADAAPAQPSRLIEHNGKKYDAARYRVKPDGTLFLNRYGQPMPRGGRKPRTAQTPESAPETSPWSAADRAAASGQPETAAPGGEPETAAEPQPDMPETITPAGTRRAAARSGTRALYMATGVVTGNPDEAIPPPREDKELQDTAAYILETSGWNPQAGVAFLILCVGYFILVGSRPKNRGALMRWWQSRGKPKKAEPATAEPSPEPVQTATNTNPFAFNS